MASFILKSSLFWKKKQNPLHILPSLPLLYPAPQNTFIISSCAFIPDLSGRINLLTAGTERQLAEGYISLSGAQRTLAGQALSTKYRQEAGFLPAPPKDAQAGLSQALHLARLVVLFIFKDASEIGTTLPVGESVIDKSVVPKF